MKKVKIKYADLEEAYVFVSAGPEYSHDALLDTQTGRMLFQSADSEELDEFPEIIDRNRYISIPTKTDLHLGRPVAISFTEIYIPDAIAEVRRIFGRKGAFSKFKDLLVRAGMLEQWYKHEEQETERALREWCQAKGILLTS